MSVRRDGLAKLFKVMYWRGILLSGLRTRDGIVRGGSRNGILNSIKE